MAVCAECGRENDADARFCSGCGARLEAVAAAPREERKVVSVLFADLVGFTARSEQLDPEDVRATLSPYYARLRSELERHGGTVEKFIGDAVMALFGAPVAHEDDPERAVRAALAIRDWVRDEEQLQVRIAVNTGEALVSLGASPSAGEGMAAGDVVNTAARLQSAAPVNGILVGERTYRATRDAIEFREAKPVEAKGKAEPLLVWEAVDARSRLGVDVPHEARTPLVGRERELELLRAALERVREDGSAQLVTLVGVPGIGKSRLLYELAQLVEEEPDLISWRQGRSLPYGEGVSFWALAEIVKAQAGILETDGAGEAEAKLCASLAELLDDGADAGWVLRHLAALVGAGDADSTVGDDRRGEAFAAWRHYLEALAEHRPLVLVFEDLHWADDGLLDFVDHLVDWASGVPLLVVASARPELLERRPGWGGGKPNATTLSLATLASDETARLIGAVLGRPVLDAQEQAELLERVGGNPLYAEQYAQMLDEVRSEGELTLPESVHGIVGARLDALPPDEKQLLQDAAVIGKVFWPGAVAALGGEGADAGWPERLHALERKQFVRRERRSSVADEAQYAFTHVLLRDVAYGQIPRAARVEKHVLAAGWLESLGRVADHAEMLAHHYVEALEIAATLDADASDLAPRARVALTEAGDRARLLNAPEAALRFYGKALELWPADAAGERAELLFRVALTYFDADADERGDALERAREALLATGDTARAAEADALLVQYWWMQGDNDRVVEHLSRAEALVRGLPASPGKARVLSQSTRFRTLAGELDLDAAQEARRLAEELGLDELVAQTAITIGTIRFTSGDPGGKADVQRGLDYGIAANRLPLIIRGNTVLATLAEQEGDLRETARLGEEALSAAERLGGGASIRWALGNVIVGLPEAGEWDRCLELADGFLAEAEAGTSHYNDGAVLLSRALVRFGRGQLEPAFADLSAALTKARRIKDRQVVLPTLTTYAYVLADAERDAEAAAFFDEALDAGPALFGFSDDVIWAADLLGRREDLSGIFPETAETRRLQAYRAFLAGDFARAAELFDSMGAVRSASLARVHGGVELDRALAFFRSVGARRYVERVEALLARSA